MKTSKYVPSALAALALAALVTPLAALPAQAADTTPPSIIGINYNGEIHDPSEDDTISLGDAIRPIIGVATFQTASGTVTVRDTDGSIVCTAPVTSYGVSNCSPESPLSVGEHIIRAEVSGLSVVSEPVTVRVVHDGTTTPPVDEATPPAKPNPGATDPGFTVGSNIDGLKIELGSSNGVDQKIDVTYPRLQANARVEITDETGAVLVSTTYGVAAGGTESYRVPAAAGEKHTFTITVSANGGVVKKKLVVDGTSETIPAPSFAFAPGVSSGRVVFDIRGAANGTATLTNSAGVVLKTQKLSSAGVAQLIGAVEKETLNEYSIVVEKDGVVSAPLTHTIDTRSENPTEPTTPAIPNPGATDPGFTVPGAGSGDDGSVEAPVVRKESKWTFVGGKLGYVYTLALQGRGLPARSVTYTMTDETGKVTTFTNSSSSALVLKQIELKRDFVTKHTLTITQTIAGVSSAPTTYEVPLV